MLRSLLLIFVFGFGQLLHAHGRPGEGQVAARIDGLKASGVAFTPVQLVAEVPQDAKTDALWQSECKRANVLRMNMPVVAHMLAMAPPYITVTLPTADGPVALELEKWQPLADGFKVTTSSGGDVPAAPALHYRGRMQGDNHSVAGLSIFGDELMAMVSGDHGTLVLGRLGGGAPDMHIIYLEQDLRSQIPFTCDARYTGGAIHPSELQDQGGDRTIRCVKLYWEADYPIFQNKGSVTAVTNYLTGLFNQSAIIFDNDGVEVQLQELFVWDTASPYTGPTTGGYLDQFGNYRTSFNGDLAHLLGFSGGGGIAWLNTLCSSAFYRMAYSGIGTGYSNVPTYSWSVNVVTHEQGHNLGSPHTHACAWNGNGTAIDGCGPAAGYTEGSCPTASLPTGGGTIMSYCHLIGGVGINFNNGFGPQPAAFIRNRINAASCLAQCGTSCDPPGPLSVSNLYSNSATLTWPNLGVAGYTLRWKPQAGSTWTTVAGLTTNSYAITGLTQNTAYEFQVMSDCGGSASAFSGSFVFTTPVPCLDTLEPNNTFATAASVALPANISALIASPSDGDFYAFSLAATSNLYISMSGLPADYDMELLNSSGVQIAMSQNAGTNSEYISRINQGSGSYVLHVWGYNGANNPVACYSLFINAYTANCPWPGERWTSDITYIGAQMNWTMVEGASSYDVRWKKTALADWNVVQGIVDTNHMLNGLEWSTEHEFQVRTICQGEGSQGIASEWSVSTLFTTLDPPCDEVPPTVVAAKALLDGAWRDGGMLMVDSLRKLNLLPLREPYTVLGFAPAGDTLTTAPVLAITGNDAIVDWVLVELRSATTPSQVLESRVALLQRDGDVVGVDGMSPLGFCQAGGDYYVAVRHRNHLGAMTAQPVLLSATATVVDFSLPATATWGTNARKLNGGIALLWSGNVVRDAEVKYTGANNDRDAILNAVGGTAPTNTVSGYHGADVTLDGAVKYTGSGNDRDMILNNLVGASPTSTITEQLP
ncbi:MAG TPA: M12 family metallo-peptidase [Flavobacteriales bacterium]|nr:M12 family metallo-peptidase [Flavobacteriales bacterium]HRP82859.1 M12 family metallo-peptidase [Flavobacteriales bacterium]